MGKRSKVVVAMSGGVDSSVAAALLQREGYEVIGMMMRLWSEPGQEEYNRCCTPDAMATARQVAAQLEIPFYAVDAQDEFHNIVVNYFLEGYSSGVTPNPCLACNRHIRWDFLLKRALALGAEFLATGHYARLQEKPEEPIKLLRGIDHEKDQSYVLSVLRQEQLEHTLFPLGKYTKSEVWEIAKELDLPAAQSKESQDLCFLAGADYAEFLRRHAPVVDNPGTIITTSGDILGEHQGLAFYTIGQRKGLGIAAPHPLYVLEKDLDSNRLIVGPHEELGKSELTAEGVNWISGKTPDKPFRAQVKIRYKAPFARGLITPIQYEAFHVRFEEPLRDITPGQAAVIYNNDIVVGSGVISAVKAII